jgi:predicted flap endonuclease-1-like 5' DNA nuclease
MSAFLCNIWWVTLGGTIAWAGYWLLDKLFRRDGAAAASLASDNSEHQRQLETDLRAARTQAKDADRLRAELMSYRSEHEAASLSLGLLHNQIESSKSAASSRSAELTKYKTDLAVAVAAASAKAIELDRVRSELDAAKKLSATHTADLTKLKADLAAAAAKADEVAKLKAELSASKLKHDASEKSLGLLQSDLDSSKKSTAAHSTELAKQKADLAAAIAAASAKSDEAARLRTELTSANTKLADLERLRSELDASQKAGAAHSADSAKLRSELTAAQAQAADAERLRAEAATAKASATETATKLAGLQSEVELSSAAAIVGFQPRKNGRDDLTLIEGIGPKIAALLTASGIDSFAILAATPTPKLQKILDDGGSAFTLANPESWPSQARLVTAGNWAELREYQDELIGGVKRDDSQAGAFGFKPAKGGKDDLTIVEGIGPKINDLLVAAGIDTFAKLARTEIPNIQAILDKAGPNFKLAQPESWPRQSRLCAAGSWEDLKILQDELIAGVKPAGKTS